MIRRRSDGTSDQNPIPAESGIDAEGVNLSKLGKEFLRMARLGDHYAAARVGNVFARQIETRGSSECDGFRATAYEEASTRYYERLRHVAMQ